MSNTEPVIPQDLQELYEIVSRKSEPDRDAVAVLIRRIARLTSDLAAANLRVEQNESKSTAHLQHVSRFLTEMYQTMIDPLDDPEPSVKIAELCEMLLNQAREDREKLNRSPFNSPADWNTDSSLETWFPLTAEEMVNLKAENAALKARLEQLSGPVTEEAYLLEVIVAAKDVLTSFQYELSYLPAQRAYKTTMSENERLCAKTIADLETIIRARSERSSHQ